MDSKRVFCLSYSTTILPRTETPTFIFASILSMYLGSRRLLVEWAEAEGEHGAIVIACDKVKEVSFFCGTLYCPAIRVIIQRHIVLPRHTCHYPATHCITPLYVVLYSITRCSTPRYVVLPRDTFVLSRDTLYYPTIRVIWRSAALPPKWF